MRVSLSPELYRCRCCLGSVRVVPLPPSRLPESVRSPSHVDSVGVSPPWGLYPAGTIGTVRTKEKGRSRHRERPASAPAFASLQWPPASPAFRPSDDSVSIRHHPLSPLPEPAEPKKRGFIYPCVKK